MVGDRQLGVADEYRNHCEELVIEGNVGHIHSERTVAMQVEIGIEGEAGRMAVEMVILGPPRLVACSDA